MFAHFCHLQTPPRAECDLSLCWSEHHQIWYATSRILIVSSAGQARGQVNLIRLYGIHVFCVFCVLCAAHVPHNNHNFELISPRQSPLSPSLAAQSANSRSPPRQFGQSISHRKVKYKYTTTTTRTRTQHDTTGTNKSRWVVTNLWAKYFINILNEFPFVPHFIGSTPFSRTRARSPITTVMIIVFV